MKLDKTVKLGRLLDIYGSLLTTKKSEMLSMYVNDNMSYQEIAESLNISKPAVLDSIKIAERKLIKLEENLKILEFKEKLEQVATSDNVKQNLISLLREY